MVRDFPRAAVPAESWRLSSLCLHGAGGLQGCPQERARAGHEPRSTLALTERGWRVLNVRRCLPRFGVFLCP